MSDMNDLAMLLESLPPEQLEQMLGLGSMDEHQDLLQQQLEQAKALRGPSREYTSPVGAALGGLADVLGSGHSAVKQQQAMDGLGALNRQRQGGRDAYSKSLVEQLRKQRAGTMADFTAPGGGVIAPIPKGY